MTGIATLFVFALGFAAGAVAMWIFIAFCLVPDEDEPARDFERMTSRKNRP